MSVTEEGVGKLTREVYLCPQCLEEGEEPNEAATPSREAFVDHFARNHGSRLEARRKLARGHVETSDEVEGYDTGQARFPVNEHTDLHEERKERRGDGKHAITKGDIERMLMGEEGEDGFYDKKNVSELPVTPTEWKEGPREGFVPEGEWYEYLGYVHRQRVRGAQNGFMVLYNKTEEEYLAIPEVIRGMGKYQARKGEKMEAIAEIAKEHAASTLVTLSPQVGYGESPYDTLKMMTEVINKWNAYLRQKTGMDLDKYVWAAEPTERGHIHYHLVYIGVDLKAHVDSIHRDLGKWWEKHGYGESQGVDVKVVRGSDSQEAVLGYLVGYLNKQNEEDWFNGMVYLTGKRTFQTSQDLNKRVTGLLGVEQLKEEDRESEYIVIGHMKNWEGIVEKKYGGEIPPPEELVEDLYPNRGLRVTPSQVRGLD